MTVQVPAYIWTPPDTLTEHVVADYETADVTRCGITYDSLPNQADAGYEPDRPWYYDHDRDDVVRCVAGCFEAGGG